ncbi:MAG: DUF488 domain-containing protein [Anaerolineaceae bacterium]|nr:DUF488 domain-containing protein [Anaerolineaceae bacterium]
MIKIKRVYDQAETGDGKRILVERLWPRGIRKEDLQMSLWDKETAPTTELRKWFNHDPEKWAEFQQRYRLELDSHPEPWKAILLAAREGTVTLLYSSHDQQHNNAVYLKKYLEEKL